VWTGYLSGMDKEWFLKRQRLVGKTSFDLGEAISRSRTVISHILNGHQKMTFEQAEIFARELNVDLPEMLSRAGLRADTGAPISMGMSDGDVTPYTIGPRDAHALRDIREASTDGSNNPNLWRVQSDSCSLAGVLVGDFILVAPCENRRPKSGALVIAQIYDWDLGSATTVLRRYDAPVLVAATMNPADQRVHVVDDRNVKIMAEVTMSWRSYSPSAAAA
jgi:hypothetical protein